MKEKDVEKSIIEYIRLMGGWCQKVHSGSAFYEWNKKKYRIKLADQGTPDILACINGKFYGIEVKRDEKEVKKRTKQKTKRDQEQMRQGEMIIESGGKFLVVGSVKQLAQDLGDL